MKKLWKKQKEIRIDGYEEYNTMHLSKNDKSSLIYGAFMVCGLTIIMACLIHSIGTLQGSKRSEQDLYMFLDTVTAYLASATDDEYIQIAEQIRDDLVLSKYNQDLEEYVQYIPNTADGCCAEQEHGCAQAYLVCTNTGELYPLDIFGAGEDPDSSEDGCISMRFAYDEISGTNAHMVFLPDENRATITFGQGRGIVSVHRMKGLFCDGCIDKILAAADDSLMPEYVLFDPANMVYHAITEGTQTIGSDTLTIGYDEEGYKIEMAYTH